MSCQEASNVVDSLDRVIIYLKTEVEPGFEMLCFFLNLYDGQSPKRRLGQRVI
jgi:hypothetical protein